MAKSKATATRNEIAADNAKGRVAAEKAAAEMAQCLSSATPDEIAAANIRNGMTAEQQYAAILRVRGAAD